MQNKISIIIIIDLANKLYTPIVLNKVDHVPYYRQTSGKRQTYKFNYLLQTTRIQLRFIYDFDCYLKNNKTGD